MKEKDTKASQNNQDSDDNENLSDINVDENMSGTMHLNDSMDESEIEKLQEELQEQKDKYLRLFADVDNLKKRNAKERLELIQTAGREVITSLLDVLDDCNRAEKQLQTAENIDQVKQGVQLVFNKLRSILQSKGLKAMESVNTEFDVEKHEAISEVPAPTPDLRGKVIAEVMKGYYLNDKIIRFAKVIVGK